MNDPTFKLEMSIFFQVLSVHLDNVNHIFVHHLGRVHHLPKVIEPIHQVDEALHSHHADCLHRLVGQPACRLRQCLHDSVQNQWSADLYNEYQRFRQSELVVVKRR